MPQQVINGVGKAGFRVSTGASVSNDTDAQAFLTAAGITDTTQKNAINELVKDLKSANLWTKMKAIYPFVGGTPTKHKWNLKDPRDLDAAYRLTFAGGGTHSSNGYKPNGTDSYADTKIIPLNNLTSGSGHASYYNRTNSTTGAWDFGSYGLNGGAYYISFSSNNTFQSYLQNNGSNAISTTTIAGSNACFLLGTRNSTTQKLFKNNTVIGTNTNSQITTHSNAKILIGACSYGNGINAYGFRECAFSSIGDGLTDTESNLFYRIVEKFQVALGRSVNATLPYYYNNNYSLNTNLFFINAGITDSTQQSAVVTLVNTLTTAGIWSKMKAVYPLVGGTATAHQYNLVNPTQYNLSFAGGWTHTSTGALSSSALNGYANTNLTPSSVLTLNNVHLSVYTRTTNGDTGDLGSIGASNVSLWLFSRFAFYCYDGNTGGDSPRAALADSAGFRLGSRTTSTNAKMYFRNTVIGTKTTTSIGSQPSVPLYLGAINSNNSGLAYKTSKQYAFASIGDGLTDAEALTFYNAVQAFQTTLGRQV